MTERTIKLTYTNTCKHDEEILHIVSETGRRKVCMKCGEYVNHVEKTDTNI